VKTDKHGYTKVPSMPAQPLVERLMFCIRMLAIHGMLAESERDKAIKRLRKKFKC
jgi:hypothetical protein